MVESSDGAGTSDARVETDMEDKEKAPEGPQLSFKEGMKNQAL